MTIRQAIEWLLIDNFIPYFMTAVLASLILIYFGARNRWPTYVRWPIYIVVSIAVLPTPLGIHNQGYMHPWLVYLTWDWGYSLLFIYWPVIYVFLIRFISNKLEKAFKSTAGGAA